MLGTMKQNLDRFARDNEPLTQAIEDMSEAIITFIDAINAAAQVLPGEQAERELIGQLMNELGRGAVGFQSTLHQNLVAGAYAWDAMKRAQKRGPALVVSKGPSLLKD